MFQIPQGKVQISSADQTRISEGTIKFICHVQLGVGRIESTRMDDYKKKTKMKVLFTEPDLYDTSKTFPQYLYVDAEGLYIPENLGQEDGRELTAAEVEEQKKKQAYSAQEMVAKTNKGITTRAALTDEQK